MKIFMSAVYLPYISGSGIGGDLNPTGIGLGRRPETVFHSLRSRGMPL